MPDSALRVGGFVPFTSIDYPGELAAVIFCQGCPWHCNYCHNPHLLPGHTDNPLNWNEILAALEMRRHFLDAVVFSGGEPLAQHALHKAIKEAKALGYKIGLHTAGCYPQRLKKLLPLLDWVGLDIKALPAQYESITGVAQSGKHAWRSLELLQHSSILFETRTTLSVEVNPAQQKQLQHHLDSLGIQDHRWQECRRNSDLSQTASVPGSFQNRT
jgi:pyruvate formate lyase activating enzyme